MRKDCRAAAEPRLSATVICERGSRGLSTSVAGTPRADHLTVLTADEATRQVLACCGWTELFGCRRRGEATGCVVQDGCGSGQSADEDDARADERRRDQKTDHVSLSCHRGAPNQGSPLASGAWAAQGGRVIARLMEAMPDAEVGA